MQGRRLGGRLGDHPTRGRGSRVQPGEHPRRKGGTGEEEDPQEEASADEEQVGVNGASAKVKTMVTKGMKRQWLTTQVTLFQYRQLLP